jgi:glycosyltransferase involved in cell wall biosynthesis
VRWFEVVGDFDVVHVHCMPVMFLGPTPAVVATDSSGTWWYWTAGKSMNADAVDRLMIRERRIAQRLGYLHPSVHPEPASAVLFFVPSGIPLLRRVGVRSQVEVCPPGVPRMTAKQSSDGNTVLFVARDFYWKGGDIVLEIFGRVRRLRPGVRLVVAGSDARPTLPPGVDWVGRMSREALYADVYPAADLLLYPTRFDTASLVAMEALANGLPVVAHNQFALPDVVRDGVTGYLFEPGAVDVATRHVLRLLDDAQLRQRMGQAAQADYEARFSVDRRNDGLGTAYRRVAGRSSPRSSA